MWGGKGEYEAAREKPPDLQYLDELEVQGEDSEEQEEERKADEQKMDRRDKAPAGPQAGHDGHETSLPATGHETSLPAPEKPTEESDSKAHIDRIKRTKGGSEKHTAVYQANSWKCC